MVHFNPKEEATTANQGIPAAKSAITNGPTKDANGAWLNEWAEPPDEEVTFVVVGCEAVEGVTKKVEVDCVVVIVEEFVFSN